METKIVDDVLELYYLTHYIGFTDVENELLINNVSWQLTRAGDPYTLVDGEIWFLEELLLDVRCGKNQYIDFVDNDGENFCVSNLIIGTFTKE